MQFSRMEPIHAGWSGDQKYRAWTEDGSSYFIRLCPPEKEEKLLWVEEWTSGEMAEEALPRLSPAEQYPLGVQAGQTAKALHSLPCSTPQESWEVRFGRKLDKKIEMYRACPLQYENGELFIRYLEENRHLLAGRPQCTQHGDFHVGNMILCDGTLAIIDFDRPDFGDPWEEFNRIVWCAQLSPAFASGLVDGYFGGTPPLLFWRLLALYISSNTLGSLPWAIPFGETESATMRKQAAEVLQWYDNMKNPIPSWYQSKAQSKPLVN